METLIKAGGVFNIGMVLFHASFWRLFRWNEDLKNISFLNRAIMQVLNISLTLVFAMFAWISFVQAHELLTTPLGHNLLILMAVFWLARSIQQIIFFKLRHPLSWVFLLVFFSGFGLYAIPAFHSLQI